VQLRRLDAVEGAAAYTTADVRLAWRATERVELSLVGQNLFERQHQEQGPYPFVASSDVMRGVYGKLAWRF
jgi:iron complex outermembrane receptor protein